MTESLIAVDTLTPEELVSTLVNFTNGVIVIENGFVIKQYLQYPIFRIRVP